MAIYTTEGLLTVNDYLLGKSVALSWRVRLFTNNFLVSVASVAGDFVECALAPYASVLLVPSNWSTSAAAGVFQGTYPTISWTFNSYAGGVTIYGWYATDDATGRSLVAETFVAPYAVPAAGGALTLAPEFFDQNLL